MARSGPDEHRPAVGDLGARVAITIVPGPRGPVLRERIAPGWHPRAIGALLAATAAAGALVAGLSLAGRGGPTQRLPTTVLPNTVLYPTYLRPRGPIAGPSAAAHPLQCLRLLIALHDPSLMNAAYDWNLPCGDARGPYTLIAVPAQTSGGHAEPHRARGLLGAERRP